MSLKSNKPRVAFSVTNSICFDQRILKIAETVSTLGCEITIIGRLKGDCCSSDSIPFKNRRFNMLFRRGFLFYGFFNIRLFIYLLFHKFDVLVANDLDTLLPNFLISRLKRIPLIYDSHEYFTAMPEVQNRLFVRKIWQGIEKFIFPKLKNVMTVSEPIALIYLELYNIRPLVVRNLSKSSFHINKYSKEELGIPSDYLVIIIQGNGINMDKGAEELISAVKLINKVALLIVGSGDVISALKSQVTDMDLSSRIKFIPSVTWEGLMRYTKSADIGLCIEKDTNLNYRYCLPNKLFDYISAGLPVIASKLPETEKIITANGFGVIIESVTPENIAEAILRLQNDPDKLSELKQKAIAASSKVNWEIESNKVIAFYNKILICG